jgi:hypothetical protein
MVGANASLSEHRMRLLMGRALRELRLGKPLNFQGAGT